MEIPQQLQPEYLARITTGDLTVVEVKSGFNNHIGILKDALGRKLVAKITPRQFSGPDDVLASVPALDNLKIKKEVSISNFLSSRGFATPACVFFEEKSSDFAVFEWAEGEIVNFNAIRTQDIESRLRMAENIAEFVAGFFALQEREDISNIYPLFGANHSNEPIRQFHESRLHLYSKHLLSIGIIDNNIMTEVLKVCEGALSQIPEGLKRLVHGDIYTGNLFIGGDGKVINLIDWSDSSELGDPLTDVILTARWIAFDGRLDNLHDPESISVFIQFINTFNRFSSKQYDPDECYKLVPFYDVMWHLQTLVSEYYKGKDEGISYFQRNLRSILSNINH